MAIRADRVGVREDQVDIHGRVTSPSFLNELLEDLPEWTDMPVWVNGTEELLPSNNSVPVTSPILTDIAYPDIRRDNQYFTYRESPTPVDGLAKIKSIKGNTLVWNQLVQNGNFADNSGWNFPDTVTISISNNELSATYISGYPSVSHPINIKKGHKFYLSFEFKASVNKNTPNGFFFNSSNNQSVLVTPLNYTTNYQKYEGVLSYNDSDLLSLRIAYFEPNRWTADDIISIKNVQLFDLTQMGLDITDPSEFTSLFNLPYYDHNQATLLSFNGNGIKTVGKNLFNARTTQINNGITFTNDNGIISISGTATANAFFTTIIGLRNGSYFIGAFNDEINSNVHVAVQTKSGAYPLDGVMSSKNRTFSINNDINNFIIWVNGGTTLNNFVLKPMISFEASENFEPYTSSTLSLPISTYFPTGMKSAGTVYDELLPTKATTRIGAVDLGSLNWTYDSSVPRFYSTGISSVVAKPSNDNTNANILCSKYATSAVSASAGGIYASGTDKLIAVGTTGTLNVKDSSYTDATAFKNSLQGQYLYYELATPVELPTMSFE